MFRSTRMRFLALLSTAAVTAALIGVAVVGTGAYFTDSKPGAITGNLGTVAVDIAGQNINFANLMPGESQTQTVTVHNTGTGGEDMWLVFNNNNGAWSAVNDFGRYGKFVINGKTYDNLNNGYDAPNSGVPGTTVPGGGPCGLPATDINYLPHAILLGTMTSNQVWTFDVTFQFSPCLSGPGGGSLWGTAPFPAGGFNPAIAPGPLNFVIAAFQQGVDPTSNLNGAGKIVPLALPYAGDVRANPGIKQ